MTEIACLTGVEKHANHFIVIKWKVMPNFALLHTQIEREGCLNCRTPRTPDLGKEKGSDVSTRIVTFHDEPRCIEGLQVLLKYGCTIRVLRRGHEIPLYTDIALVGLGDESPKTNKSTCVRHASHRVPWNYPDAPVPNRIGVYDNGANLVIPLLEGVVRIEKWREGTCQGFPWGPSTPSGETNKLLLQQWVDEVHTLNMHCRTWSSTPRLEEKLSNLQRIRSQFGVSPNAFSSFLGWSNE